MRVVASFIIVLCVVLSAHAQTYHKVKDLGMNWFGSRIFDSGTGSWIVLDNRGSDSLWGFWRLHDRWRLDPMSSGGTLPFKNVHTKSIAFAEHQGWVGTLDKVAYTTDYSTWNEIDISESGREVAISNLSLYEGGIGVIASLWSYVVTRADTTNGVVMKWTSQTRNSVALITPTSKTVLYIDSSTFRHPLTNVVQLNPTTFVVGFMSSSYSMALLHTDGTIEYINRPAGTLAGPALHLHRTADNDIYCFYGSADIDGARHPSAVVYHANTGLSEYVNLEDVGSVQQATSSEGLVIGAMNGGLAIIKGSTARRLLLPDTSYDDTGIAYPFPMDVYGVDFVNADTLICNSQRSLVVIPRSVLTPTSVEAPSASPMLSVSNNRLRNVVDGTHVTQWQLFDNTCRVLQSGSIPIGQQDLTLQLEGVPSGVYHLRLHTDGVKVNFQSVLITR